jgi:hypothetical protein
MYPMTLNKPFISELKLFYPVTNYWKNQHRSCHRRWLGILEVNNSKPTLKVN